MNARTFRPITTTLIRRSMGWVLLCSLVFSGLQAWLTYESVQKDFQVAVRDVANTHVPLLSLAVWDIEPQTIQRQLDLLLESPQIGHAMVRVNTGQQFEGGKPGAAMDGAPLRFDLPQPNRPGTHIGTLELRVDSRMLYREILRNVAWTLLQGLVLTGLILGLVVTILRRDLERPMQRLASFVTRLKPDNITQELALQRVPGHAYDEIDLVADGFRTLQENIHHHILTLDSKVLERTSQLEEALASLKALSSVDPLTGCFNRLTFNERLPSEMGRTKRYGRALSVIFCDADKFKFINDSYGHLVGDRVLALLGKCLRQELRAEVDWVARYGGEEFVLVLPETPLAAALEIAERLRQRVEQDVTLRLADGRQLHVTASFGVAQQQEQETMESLLHRADEWLYVAKNEGRNLVLPPRSLPQSELLV
jgi:diguanylate cyclase (GGDEF)-like protein